MTDNHCYYIWCRLHRIIVYAILAYADWLGKLNELGCCLWVH